MLPVLHAFTAAQPSAHSPALLAQLAAPDVAQLAVAQPAGSPQAVLAQLAAPTAAQLAAFAPDWDEKDANTLIKLSIRTRITETSGSKIQQFVDELELYLQMWTRPVHHLGLLSSSFSRHWESGEYAALARRQVRRWLRDVQKRRNYAFRKIWI